MPFKIDGYEPSSMKLFSKCARNQASKSLTTKQKNSHRNHKQLTINYLTTSTLQ